jgi:hypothetical protein
MFKTIILRSHYLLLTAFILLLGSPMKVIGQSEQTGAPSMLADNPLQIVSFAQDQPYTVGSSRITVVGCLQNASSSAVPAGIFIARVYALAGMDYANADNISPVIALTPNASLSYRWLLQPTSSSGPLVAAMAIQGGNYRPVADAIPIYRFASTPFVNSSVISHAPIARVNGDTATIENQRLRAYLGTTDSGVSALFAACRIGAGWRTIGVSLPLAEVLSGEGGQIPWRELFRGESYHAYNTKQEAVLVVDGSFGLRWHARITLTLQNQSPLLRMTMRLTPLKPLKLSAIDFGGLKAGDSSFGSPSETLQPPSTASVSQSSNAADSANPAAAAAPTSPSTQTNAGILGISAARWGDITVGVRWPECDSLSSWQSAPLKNPDGVTYYTIGGELKTSDAPVDIAPGQFLDFQTRIILVAPSKKVLDAIYLPVAHAAVKKSKKSSSR